MPARPCPPRRPGAPLGFDSAWSANTDQNALRVMLKCGSRRATMAIRENIFHREITRRSPCHADTMRAAGEMTAATAAVISPSANPGRAASRRHTLDGPVRLRRVIRQFRTSTATPSWAGSSGSTLGHIAGRSHPCADRRRGTTVRALLQRRVLPGRQLDRTWGRPGERLPARSVPCPSATMRSSWRSTSASTSTRSTRNVFRRGSARSAQSAILGQPSHRR